MWKKLCAHMRALKRGLRGRAGQIVYCAGIALALTAIAFAAEAYRSGWGSRAEDVAVAAAEQTPVTAQEMDAARALRAPEGALLRDWTPDPAWNGELGLWESHPARDYRLDGGAVKCLCDGVVRAVGVSGALGGYVEVESGDLLLRYASMSPREDLRPGDVLTAGETIGAQDASLPGECAMGAHLHLEACRGGAAIDCATLFEGD